MEESKNIIICPRCQLEINVSEVLFDQVKEQLQKDFDARNAEKEEDYQEKLKELKSAKKELEESRKSIQDEVDKAVKIKLNKEKTTLEEALRQQINEEKSEEVKTLQDELNKKSKQVKDFNKTKAENLRLIREKEEMRGSIELEMSEKYSQDLAAEKQRIITSEVEKNRTELQKKEKMIADLNERLTEAQQKIKQGSNKLAGEVKEIELREYLQITFPVDEIKDVPSGVSGADVIQVVRSSTGQHSGMILYERKETKAFGKDWISKLKEDGRRVKADICVIVTRAMPKENSETHFNDGVWVCTYDDLNILTTLLRDGLLKQYAALASQSDKGTKMEMLYDYLRSNDFRNHIVGILDAFRKMDDSLTKEKEAAIKKFAEREGHIFQAKQSILNFWGRVEGIAIDSLNQEMKRLEESAQKQLE